MRLDPTELTLALAASKEAVTAARAQNRQALADERRMRNLLAEKAVSTKDYDHAKSLADATMAQLSAAIANAKQMEKQVDYALLRADADGEIMADFGQVVNTGSVVVLTSLYGFCLAGTASSIAKKVKTIWVKADGASYCKWCDPPLN